MRTYLLYKTWILEGWNSLLLSRTQTFKQPSQLLIGNRDSSLFFSGPMDAACFDPLVSEDESGTVPIDCLKAVCASSAEQEQAVRKWIEMKHLLNNAGQAVYPSPHVCIAGGQIDPVEFPSFKHSITTFPIQFSASAGKTMCAEHSKVSCAPIIAH